MKFKIILILMIAMFFLVSCHKENVPPVSISFLGQTQTFYNVNPVEPGDITVDYIIYNNTMRRITHCEVYFIVYYKDNTYEITDADVTVDIRNDQRNDLTIFTNKEMSYVDVYSVSIDGGGCRYNIVEH